MYEPGIRSRGFLKSAVPARPIEPIVTLAEELNREVAETFVGKMAPMNSDTDQLIQSIFNRYAWKAETAMLVAPGHLSDEHLEHMIWLSNGREADRFLKTGARAVAKRMADYTARERDARAFMAALYLIMPNGHSVCLDMCTIPPIPGQHLPPTPGKQLDAP